MTQIFESITIWDLQVDNWLVMLLAVSDEVEYHPFRARLTNILEDMNYEDSKKVLNRAYDWFMIRRDKEALSLNGLLELRYSDTNADLIYSKYKLILELEKRLKLIETLIYQVDLNEESKTF